MIIEDSVGYDLPLKKQYMQLMPIRSKQNPAESFDNPTSSPEYEPLSLSTRSWEVSRDKIVVNKVIGKGAFGQVAKGTATDLPGQNGKTTVALKMLKGVLTGSIVKCFRQKLS